MCGSQRSTSATPSRIDSTQYGLVDHAQKLGWPKDRILVIDEDLGVSGASVEGRQGFQRLLSEVALNHVGLILGIEMSRLARVARIGINCWSCAPCSAR